MTIQLDKVKNSDLSILCDMYSDLSTELLSFNLDKMTDQLKGLGDDDNIFIIKIKDLRIGVIQMHICKDLIDSDRPFVVIENFYIKPEFRNKGYGKEALLRVIDLAKEYDAYHIMLLSSNNECRKKSHALYKSVGFDDKVATAFRMYI